MQSILLPVCINRTVGCNLCFKVVRSSAFFSALEPAQEDIVLPGYSLIGNFLFVIDRFCQRIRIAVFEPAAIRIKGKLIGRQPEIPVESQACGHFGSAAVSAGMFGVSKPAQPLSAFHRCFRYFARQIGRYVIIQCDLMSPADLSTIVVKEFQRILFGFIIEINDQVCVRSAVSKGIVFLFIMAFNPFPIPTAPFSMAFNPTCIFARIAILAIARNFIEV